MAIKAGGAGSANAFSTATSSSPPAKRPTPPSASCSRGGSFGSRGRIAMVDGGCRIRRQIQRARCPGGLVGGSQRVAVAHDRHPDKAVAEQVTHVEVVSDCVSCRHAVAPWRAWMGLRPRPCCCACMARRVRARAVGITCCGCWDFTRSTDRRSARWSRATRPVPSLSRRSSCGRMVKVTWPTGYGHDPRRSTAPATMPTPAPPVDISRAGTTTATWST